MDWKNIEKKLNERLKVLFEQRSASSFAQAPEGMSRKERNNFRQQSKQNFKNMMTEEERRLRKIYGRVGSHINHLADRQTKIDKFARLTDEMVSIQDQMDAGLRIASFDTEFKHGVIREFGVAYYVDGEVKSFNIHVDNMPQKREFLFGSTLFMPVSRFKAEVVKMLKPVDIVVGHNLRKDFEIMANNGIHVDHKIVLDTSDWFALMSYPESPSLKEACKLFGIDPHIVHNAGNDATYNMQLALKMMSGRIKMKTNTTDIVIE